MQTMATRKISVEESAGAFAATYDGDASVHFEKSRQLARIGESTNLFTAPRPIAISDSKDRIEWQFLPGLLPIRDALLRMTVEQQIDASQRIGATLAVIHRDLDLAGDVFSPRRIVSSMKDLVLQERVATELDKAPVSNVHGDYACANLFLDQGNRIVTLDPEPNIYLFERADPSIRASAYLEISLLIQSLASRPDFVRSLRGGIDRICEACLDGYDLHATWRLDRRVVFALAAEIMLIYRSYRLNDGTETWIGRVAAGHFRKHAARRLSRLAKL